MKAKTILTLVFVLTICAILSAVAVCRHFRGNNVAVGSPARMFQVHGTVRGVDVSNRTIRIAHDEIPNYMPPMTMPFAVREAAALAGVSAGDEVQFQLNVTDKDSWVSHVEKVSSNGFSETAAAANVTQEVDSGRIDAGELVPDFGLIDQNGRPIRLRDFKGKVVLVTFIYTRCPLPNYCPLMSANFAQLQTRLSKEFPDRYHLLSVSIDPGFDQPAVLKEYGARFGADEKHWSLATGTPGQVDFVARLVALFHEPENGFISHDLRTALIGPDGRLVHVWKSNVWTPYEVQRMVGESLNGAKDLATAR
jgi:protein SCO1/2